MKILQIIIVTLLIFSSISFSFASRVTSPRELQEKNIENKIKNIYSKLEHKYGNEKTIKIFKKVGQKLLKIQNTRGNSIKKRGLYKMYGNAIYKKILGTQDNSLKIVKVLDKGIFIKQNIHGVGYTVVEAYGKEVFRGFTLNRAFCYPYSVGDCEVNITNNLYEISEENAIKIKNRAIKHITINKNKFSLINYNLLLLQIGFYEGIASYIIDKRNKIFYTQRFQGIQDIKKGKSGFYFISSGYGPEELYFLSNNFQIKKLYSGKSSESLTGKKYELLINKKIKLFLSGNRNYEKIINID